MPPTASVVVGASSLWAATSRISETLRRVLVVRGGHPLLMLFMLKACRSAVMAGQLPHLQLRLHLHTLGVRSELSVARGWQATAPLLQPCLHQLPF